MRKPRTLWTEKHDLILREWSGKLPASKIATMTGHCERVILERQRLKSLPAYHAKRAGWTRRDYLLAGAAGLAVEGNPW